MFIQNISPFLIGFNTWQILQNQLAMNQIWKMRAIYHQFDGILPQYKAQPRFQAAVQQSCCFSMCEQKKSRLPDDEIAELLIQTERGECQKKMRTISLDGCHLLFEVYLQREKTSVHIMKLY